MKDWRWLADQIGGEFADREFKIVARGRLYGFMEDLMATRHLRLDLKEVSPPIGDVPQSV